MNNDAIKLSIWDSNRDSLSRVLPILKSHYAPRAVSEKWLAYKFCPASQPTIAAVAWDGDHPIGIIGVSVRKFRAPERLIEGAFSLIVFVDDRYRGQRVAPRLLEKLHEHLLEGPVEFIIALPNPKYEPVLAKSGYIHVANHTTSIYPVSLSAGARLLRSPGKFKDFTPLSPHTPTVSEIQQFVSNQETPAHDQVMSFLSVDDLRHQLSTERQYHYSIIHLDDLSAILSRGTRGHVSEARILATAPRILSPADLRKLVARAAIDEKTDIVTVRKSAIAPSRIQANIGGLTLRASPPVYVRSTVEPDSNNLNLIALSGIDAHTW